jgi:uncharacterized C2H2 Zn-finger protein
MNDIFVVLIVLYGLVYIYKVFHKVYNDDKIKKAENYNKEDRNQYGLKRCPFCGSGVIGFENEYSKHKEKLTFVVCNSCGSRTKSISSPWSHEMTKQYWNDRRGRFWKTTNCIPRDGEVIIVTNKCGMVYKITYDSKIGFGKTDLAWAEYIGSDDDSNYVP